MLQDHAIHIDSLSPSQTNASEQRLSSELTHEKCILAAVLISRIYSKDKARITVAHLQQWMRFMSFAGVQEFYIYDTYENPSEKSEYYFKYNPKVVYTDWNHNMPFDLQRTQVSAYQDAIDRHKHKCTWQLAMDVDEYPLVMNDYESRFLHRFLAKYEEQDIGEISIPNFLLVGPTNFDERFWLGERYHRLTKTPGNNLVKPIYRPERIAAAGMHHNSIQSGWQAMEASDNEIKMIHVWGGRVVDFEENRNLSDELLDKTVLFDGLAEVIAKVKLST